ncbi:hypothetical protein QFC19_007464 [Naganishia cerealis]|uniref:Uncharacterized protein n=1 Tax=Naganishia cerealis TaxID=610337 RepID=A0ACC2V9K3_9TREE|nr:hypothetical protein QFC19_007464 [Naganishia cerealis]
MTTSIASSRSGGENRELERQLNVLREENQDLQQKHDALLRKSLSLEAWNDSLSNELEITQEEASRYKQYYGKWEVAQKELDESKVRFGDLQSQFNILETEKNAMEANHKRRSEGTKHALQQMHKEIQQLYSTIKILKGELAMFRGDGKYKASGSKRSSNPKVFAQELDKENRQGEVPHDAPLGHEKRKYSDAFNEPDGKTEGVKIGRHASPLTDLDAQFGPGDSARLPLSQSSAHNSPISSRTNRKRNARGDTEQPSPFHDRKDVQTRVLAEETQSASQNQETEETVPLDFEDVKAESEDTLHRPEPKPKRKPIVNLHDKTTSRPLVSPETETVPLLHGKANPDGNYPESKPLYRDYVLNLHDKTTLNPLVSPETESALFFQGPRVKLETADRDQLIEGSKARQNSLEYIQSNATKRGRQSANESERPKSNRTLRSRTTNDWVPSKTERSLVKHETPVAAIKRNVKQETPLRSEGPSRSATLATGTKPLLPIRGWKGGKKSARAFVRRDSFEDDDGFGDHASIQGSTVTRTREAPMHVDNAAGGHPRKSAIPGYMSTEITRNRTSIPENATPGRSTTGVRSSPAPESVNVKKVDSNRAYERSATTGLRDRNRNVGPGMASWRATPALSVDGKKEERQSLMPSRLRREGKDTECDAANDDVDAGGDDGTFRKERAGQERYEINPDRNHGLTYAYQNVERRKEERKKMTGHGCIECENYYNAVGEMPVPKRGPIWRSPSPESKRRDSRRQAAGKCPHGRDMDDDDDASGDDGMDGAGQEAKQRHMNQISRHRDDEVEEINEQAEQQRQAKRAEMKREAEKKDGKYRRVGG